MNPEQKALFIKRFSEYFNISKAARMAQTTRSVVMKNLREDKAFREAFEDAREEVLDDVEENLYKQSQRSPIAAMQLLKAKRSKEWGGVKKAEPVDKSTEKLKQLLGE